MLTPQVCIYSNLLTNCVSGTSEEHAGQPMWQLMDGSPKAQQTLLQMRANCAFYCEVLDHYAPAVVGVAKWNNVTNMQLFCTTYDTRAFAKPVLTGSDEAFIILVLINATPPWMAEIICRKQGMWWVATCQHLNAMLPLYKKYAHGRQPLSRRTMTKQQTCRYVWHCSNQQAYAFVDLLLIVCSYNTDSFIHLFARLQGKTNNGGGSGWIVEGKGFYDLLQQIVKADHEKQASSTQAGIDGITFNKVCINIICNAKKMKATKRMAATMTNNQNKRNQHTSALMSLRMIPKKKTDGYKTVQQLARNSSQET
jgi:hypothetical protein